jgi:hypothetical protein
MDSSQANKEIKITTLIQIKVDKSIRSEIEN